MKMVEIEKEWERDCHIDQALLDEESSNTHGLHCKYNIFLNEETKVFIKLGSEYDKLKLDKYEYYDNSLDKEILEKRGWKPFGLKLIKTKIPMYVDGDDEIISMKMKIDIQKQKIDFLKSIVNQINNRSFIIRNVIEWRKFTSGVN